MGEEEKHTIELESIHFEKQVDRGVSEDTEFMRQNHCEDEGPSTKKVNTREQQIWEGRP